MVMTSYTELRIRSLVGRIRVVRFRGYVNAGRFTLVVGALFLSRLM